MAIDPAKYVQVATDLLFRNWGTKVLALILAAILFVSTRDQVTREFDIPLRVVEDPDRVLLTELPQTIQVQIRGPWTRVNRLQAGAFESAVLDLREAKPGPLQIDKGSIVMPSGVVLADTLYKPVDLRFDVVVEEPFPITASVVGQPADDHRLVSIEVDPTTWTVRGAGSVVKQIETVETVTIDVSGENEDVAADVALRPPGRGAAFVGENVEVRVTVIIDPIMIERDMTVSVSAPDLIDPTNAIPNFYQVEVRGALVRFRELESLGIAFPIVADVVAIPEAGESGTRLVEIRFRWADAIPSGLRDALEIDLDVVRVTMPPLPPPDAPPDQAPP